MLPDLKKEQKATFKRAPYGYSLEAKVFFWMMDLIAGRKITLPKVKLIELLATIPYRSWEILHYARMTRCYRDQALVKEAREIVMWSRESQDNEYWHLLVVNEKMKADGIKDPWYLMTPIPLVMVGLYTVLMRILPLVSIRRAFLFNAEFEDHAEHSYAQFVEEHPEWDRQTVHNGLVQEYGEQQTWADVFRRIGLDERDHRNMSFISCGKPECVVHYDGTPEIQRT